MFPRQNCRKQWNRHPIQRVRSKTDSWDFSTTWENCSNFGVNNPHLPLHHPYTTLKTIPNHRSFLYSSTSPSPFNLLPFTLPDPLLHGEEQKSMHCYLETPSHRCNHLCNRSHGYKSPKFQLPQRVCRRKISIYTCIQVSFLFLIIILSTILISSCLWSFENHSFGRALFWLSSPSSRF